MHLVRSNEYYNASSSRIFERTMLLLSRRSAPRIAANYVHRIDRSLSVRLLPIRAQQRIINASATRPRKISTFNKYKTPSCYWLHVRAVNHDKERGKDDYIFRFHGHAWMSLYPGRKIERERREREDLLVMFIYSILCASIRSQENRNNRTIYLLRKKSFFFFIDSYIQVKKRTTRTRPRLRKLLFEQKISAIKTRPTCNISPLSCTNFLKKVHAFDFRRLKLQTLDDGFEKASDVSAKSSAAAYPIRLSSASIPHDCKKSPVSVLGSAQLLYVQQAYYPMLKINRHLELSSRSALFRGVTLLVLLGVQGLYAHHRLPQGSFVPIKSPSYVCKGAVYTPNAERKFREESMSSGALDCYCDCQCRRRRHDDDGAELVASSPWATGAHPAYTYTRAGLRKERRVLALRLFVIHYVPLARPTLYIMYTRAHRERHAAYIYSTAAFQRSRVKLFMFANVCAGLPRGLLLRARARQLLPLFPLFFSFFRELDRKSPRIFSLVRERESRQQKRQQNNRRNEIRSTITAARGNPFLARLTIHTEKSRQLVVDGIIYLYAIMKAERSLAIIISKASRAIFFDSNRFAYAQYAPIPLPEREHVIICAGQKSPACSAVRAARHKSIGAAISALSVRARGARVAPFARPKYRSTYNSSSELHHRYASRRCMVIIYATFLSLSRARAGSRSRTWWPQARASATFFHRSQSRKRTQDIFLPNSMLSVRDIRYTRRRLLRRRSNSQARTLAARIERSRGYLAREMRKFEMGPFKHNTWRERLLCASDATAPMLLMLSLTTVYINACLLLKIKSRVVRSTAKLPVTMRARPNLKCFILSPACAAVQQLRSWYISKCSAVVLWLASRNNFTRALSLSCGLPVLARSRELSPLRRITRLFKVQSRAVIRRVGTPAYNVHRYIYTHEHSGVPAKSQLGQTRCYKRPPVFRAYVYIRCYVRRCARSYTTATVTARRYDLEITAVVAHPLAARQQKFVPIPSTVYTYSNVCCCCACYLPPNM
ncbi:unnamed protein product [Trichogramma brassicae]|uniref:Uncharacterized protein n=1 Tax=Trichogramma brassicae TaxID=86971 RepID=A0A6H5I3N0_9HYME|nr:unnamed protein product [Trichogramma brassicae]